MKSQTWNNHDHRWQPGQQVEILITDVADSGDGVGRVNQQVVFVPQTVTGDRVWVRLVQIKRQYMRGKLLQILSPSPHRVRPSCIVADKCGGCQWQHIAYSHQLEIKQHQVVQTLQRIGKLTDPPVDPILPTEPSLHYRNKATYPLEMSSTGQIKAGYYRQGSHKVVNINQCPIQDSGLDPLLAGIKQDIQKLGWQIYEEKQHQGEIRYLSVRVGSRTGEILLTLVVTHTALKNLEKQANLWMQQYPNLVGVCANINKKRTNTILGKHTDTIAGRSYLQEIFAGYRYNLRSDTFFQVNTATAEALLQEMEKTLPASAELLVDAYCGVGTFTLPLSQRVQRAIAIEMQPEAIELAKQNAAQNHLTNIEFYDSKVEALLPQLQQTPDIVLLDPPRKGCDRSVIETLRQIQPTHIVYVSCKVATLARDLQLLCQDGIYRLQRVQPADFFPQTSHVECAAFLVKNTASP
ncbi:23S rRNA (uracil(1939)-C(5))-methyltransferase RlmD [Geitlerinema sp. PCC 9228]|jgi:23S rRNA (uracil1939-C5)-methyltransferase|uniref:23S rRNA (uracil(1939)-C(5))-methyltransferase RlmD n=1 Tax=Geitlerinema sp. PCC 9228 TaxID=111611 RepID=UPI0008F995AC|nr:23S rRNA (uracil(1939)-C(5))-methyltransferase RlmD [Geitlerinema sp. PCC 9228]